MVRIQSPDPLPARSEAADPGPRRIAGRLSLASFWDAVDPRPAASGDPPD